MWSRPGRTLKRKGLDDFGATMRTVKSIADEVLRRKAEAEKNEVEKTEAEKAETEKVDELVKAVIAEKLKEIEAEKAEASKPDDLEVHTTKPMSDLEIHAVEPVVPIEEKPVREKPIDRPVVVKKVRVQEKPVEAKPAEKNPEKPGAREFEEKRKLNLMPPFSPFERRRSRKW